MVFPLFVGVSGISCHVDAHQCLLQSAQQREPIESLFTVAQSDPSVSNVEQSFDLSKFRLLPIGINIGQRNIVTSIPVLGAEDGRDAINFDEWLVPFQGLMEALGYTVTPKTDGLYELRSRTSIINLDPKLLITDSKVGLSLSIRQIRELLKLPVNFSIQEYALVFDIPDLLQSGEMGYLQKEEPINLEGLPNINAPTFSLSAISQDTLVNGGENRSTNTQGTLSSVGTAFSGSWFTRINQEQLDDPSTWQLREFQYLKQTPDQDYAIGTQPTFWQGISSGDYVGLSFVKRFGFNAPQTFGSLGQGFTPAQRLTSESVQRNISGRAEPGTLVRLVTTQGNAVVAEQLVDSSGVYRFDNIDSSRTTLSGGTSNLNYRIFLYPQGQLSRQPEIREIDYYTLGGQLSPGTSAFIASVGSSRNLGKNDFIGSFNDIRGGLGYRFGVNNSLTLGAGAIYDQNVLGLGELFFQPPNIPLRVQGNFLIGTDNAKGWKYIARATYDPTNDLRFSFDSDEISERANVFWQLSRNFSLNSNWDSNENAFGGGVSVNFGNNIYSTSASLNIDTNSNLRWSSYNRYRRWELSHVGNEVATTTELTRKLTGRSIFDNTGSSLFLNYDTDSTNGNKSLAVAGWRYRSADSEDGYSRWSADIGYGFNDVGSGIVLSVSRALLPGLYLSSRYQSVDLSSNESSFSLQLSSNALVQPNFGLGTLQSERLRSEGGLLLQPFYDTNQNGKRDQGEKIYTEDVSDLFFLNNRPLRNFGYYAPQAQSNGITFRLAPDTYRLDVDPSGVPIGWQTSQSSYAVHVVAGSYTPIEIPLTPAYVVIGTLTDANGQPMPGAKVEAIPQDKNATPRLSITNGAGIFYLEKLEQGKYDLFVNSQIPVPSILEITPDTKPLEELNLKQSGAGESIKPQETFTPETESKPQTEPKHTDENIETEPNNTKEKDLIKSGLDQTSGGVISEKTSDEVSALSSNNVPSEEIKVEAEALQPLSNAEAEPLPVETKNTVEEKPNSIPQGYGLIGTVHDANGLPVTALTVEAVPLSGQGDSIRVATDKDGIYYFSGLKIGEYQLKINGQSSEKYKISFNESSYFLANLDLVLNSDLLSSDTHAALNNQMKTPIDQAIASQAKKTINTATASNR